MTQKALLPNHPEVLRTRETLHLEWALEAAYRRPFQELLAEARRSGQCEEADLLDLGRVLYADLVRLVRGEISSLSFPKRLPTRGEYAPVEVL